MMDVVMWKTSDASSEQGSLSCKDICNKAQIQQAIVDRRKMFPSADQSLYLTFVPLD